MTVEILALILSSLMPIILALVTSWVAKPRHALHWIVLPPKSMMEIADEISDRLITTFDDRTVSNLTKFSFIIHNTGHEPIDDTMIVEPVMWKGPGEILGTRVVTSSLPVKLQVDQCGHDVILSWKLFNQRCKALIEVICESKAETDRESVGSLNYQIKRLPEISVKYRNYLDETELRRRMKRNIAHTPKLLRFLIAENMSIFMLRHGPYFFTGYISIFFGAVGFVVAEEELNAEWWATGIGVSLFLSTSIAFAYIFRNPYISLLRNRSNQDQGNSTHSVEGRG